MKPRVNFWNWLKEGAFGRGCLLLFAPIEGQHSF